MLGRLLSEYAVSTFLSPSEAQLSGAFFSQLAQTLYAAAKCILQNLFVGRFGRSRPTCRFGGRHLRFGFFRRNALSQRAQGSGSHLPLEILPHSTHRAVPWGGKPRRFCRSRTITTKWQCTLLVKKSCFGKRWRN